MPECNRVTPYGEIVASPLRGRWMGNRGCLHRGHEIVRPWNGKRWIICALQFKGWTAPKWQPNRWTALFFFDEALALAAGHRPCALCRRLDYERYLASTGFADAESIDTGLHAERLHRRRKRSHPMPWRDVPPGTFVDLAGTAYVVLHDSVRRWSQTQGYREPRTRPKRGDATVLTPPISVRAIGAGYVPQLSAHGGR